MATFGGDGSGTTSSRYCTVYWSQGKDAWRRAWGVVVLGCACLGARNVEDGRTPPPAMYYVCLFLPPQYTFRGVAATSVLCCLVVLRTLLQYSSNRAGAFFAVLLCLTCLASRVHREEFFSACA